MNNKRGMALPIVIVFLFLSQLLYMSLLSYNQIQSQRYKNFTAYYENQIQFALAKQLLAATDINTKMEEELDTIIKKQTDYFARLLPIEQELYRTKQMVVYQANDNAVVLMAHYLYLDEQFPKSLLPLNNFVLDGVLLKDGKKQMTDEELMQQVNRFITTMQENHLQENIKRKKQRNFQYRIQVDKLPVQLFHFENGTVIVEQRLNEWRLNSTVNDSRLTAVETLPKQAFQYLIESYAYYFEPLN
ncbi:hypothetical protein JXA27_03085 [Aerococcaceae bacterium zg-B36]|uniref:hypothetical protein n=1 Tax=Aerococcaceae bacterium zg-252 TaxID=2796928 RepID=UPI001BD8DF9C|nr:hypothetical protein [Aerococcaceae bacterium zg-B36]